MSEQSRELTILSRPDCHLCHVAIKMAQGLPGDWHLILREVNVDGDPELAARYGTRIPVVLLNGTEILAGVFTEGDLRRAVARARPSVGPIASVRDREKERGGGDL